MTRDSKLSNRLKAKCSYQVLPCTEMNRGGLTRLFRQTGVSTVDANINEVEKQIAEKVGRKYAVELSTGTAALHLVIKL